MHHQEIVHSNSAYDCKVCNEFFSSMEDMRTHLKKNHSYRKDN
ncbi:MAG: C2H2-type zinc finger protein [Nitrosopumilaceae archaeon]